MGDPKQSIYRFRRADVLTYSAQVRELESRERVARIDVNFRSTGALLDVVNAIGREVFASDEGAGSQATWQDLVAHAREDDARPTERSLVVGPLEAAAVAVTG